MTPQEHIAITKYDLLFEYRLSKVETTQDAILKALLQIESNFNRIEAKFDNECKSIRKDSQSNFKWFMTGFGIVILTVLSTLITIAIKTNG